MKKNKLGWAIIGLGQQAEKIAKSIKASKNGVLIAVCDKTKDRAENFSKMYGVKEFYTSYPELLKNNKIDAVFVSSPNNEHKNHVILATKSGKHVLCEKPMALSYADGQLMTKSAEDNKVRLGVGFHLRHHPIHQEAKNIIQEGKIGKPLLIKIDWSVGVINSEKTPLAVYKDYMSWRNDPKKSGGGALMARGVHIFDLLRFLTGDEVTMVTAHTDIDKKTSIDTTALGIIQLRSSIAMVSTSRRIPYSINDVSIFGDKGRLILKTALTTDSTGVLELTSNNNNYKKRFKKFDVYQKEIENFGESILEKKSFGASAIDGLKSIEITKAFIKSANKKLPL